LERHGRDWQLTFAERRRVLLSSLFGVEICPRLVATTQAALADVGAAGDPTLAQGLHAELARNVHCGDALVGPDFDGAAPGPKFSWPDAFGPVLDGADGGFDAVIGNPPYVNARRLTRDYGPAVKDYLRQHYRWARGAYDLYVLFVEKAWHLLRPGGLCGFLLPNKIATAGYAAACRAWLQEQTAIRSITDLAGCRVFPEASVYPYAVIWRKGPPAEPQRVVIRGVAAMDELQVGQAAGREVPQTQLDAAQGWPLGLPWDIESRVPTRPLGELARLHCGTAGFRAGRIAAALREAGAATQDAVFDFVVSGNIDRYAIRLGQVRFMKRRFVRPQLAVETPALSLDQRRLFRSEKIVLAGLSRRLEAAWDPGGLALGVQVYALVPPRGTGWYLLGLLNSKLLSFLFRERYAAKRLAGGYVAMNGGQLSCLPIRWSEGEDALCSAQRRIARLAHALDRLARVAAAHPRSGAAERRLAERRNAADQEIDRLVYQLYQLTVEEIEEVERAFADPLAVS
jgi:hypothetical protein